MSTPKTSLKRSFTGNVDVKAKKTLRGCPVDLVVVVGHEEKSYESLRAFVCNGSTELDMMVNHASVDAEGNEIKIATLRFPQFTPEQWEAFEPFLLPPDNVSGSEMPEITKQNAGVLYPLFHYWQMTKREEECGKILTEMLSGDFDDDFTPLDFVTNMILVCECVCEHTVSSHEEWWGSFHNFLSDNPDEVTVDVAAKMLELTKHHPPAMATITMLMENDDEYEWDVEEELENNLLPTIICLGAQKMSMEKKQEEITAVISELANDVRHLHRNQYLDDLEARNASSCVKSVLNGSGIASKLDLPDGHRF